MRKFLPISLAWLLMIALCVLPAMADVNILVNVDKDKNILPWEGYDYTEYVYITKTINVTVLVTDTGEKAAEADANVNQVNASNLACENCAEKIDLIQGAVLGNEGITNVNQSVGNMNNQGNVVSLAAITSGAILTSAPQ